MATLEELFHDGFARTDKDPAAQREFVRTVTPLLIRYFERREIRGQASDDLAAQVIILAWRNAAKYRPPLPVAPWLFAIARRVFLTELRERARSLARAPGGDDAGPLALEPWSGSGPTSRALARFTLAEIFSAALAELTPLLIDTLCTLCSCGWDTRAAATAHAGL